VKILLENEIYCILLSVQNSRKKNAHFAAEMQRFCVFLAFVLESKISQKVKYYFYLVLTGHCIEKLAF
jgi:hypothetical protein